MESVSDWASIRADQSINKDSRTTFLYIIKIQAALQNCSPSLCLDSYLLVLISIFSVSLRYMKPAEINTKFKELQQRIAEDFDSDLPDIKVLLFLIGVQELGQGPKKFTKRQKEELMHIATCKLFSQMGFYELEGADQDGWPHWKLVKPIPGYTLLEQEMMMKSLIVTYFADIHS
jgi:hypothetical protein